MYIDIITLAVTALFSLYLITYYNYKNEISRTLISDLRYVLSATNIIFLHDLCWWHQVLLYQLELQQPLGNLML